MKYSPVYKSHCCAFGKACEESGYSVKYLFSSAYEWMLPTSIKKKTVFIGSSTDIWSMVKDTLAIRNNRLIDRIFSEDKPTHIYLHNYHFLNNRIAYLCKKNDCKFIYHVHEPYVKNKRAHGGFQQYWLYLNEYMIAHLLHSTDVAIVSSEEGSKLFEQAFPWFKGQKVTVPLIYEDLAKSINCQERKYITFVGPPVPAKGPEIFLKIVDYASEHNLSWSFLIISREAISNSKYKKKNLTLFCKKLISDEEYGRFMLNSLVVLTPYKRETQSSVVLVSYMYGTPVVASNVGGLPEFVNTGQNGYLVDINSSVEEWVEAINYVIQHGEMQAKCRNYFIENFSSKNWEKKLGAVLI